jgi:hypothetical protein
VGVRRTAEIFYVRRWTGGFFTYHGVLTITSLGRIISRDVVMSLLRIGLLLGRRRSVTELRKDYLV